MDWSKAERYEGGADGFYQLSESPVGYCVSYTKVSDSRAVFNVSIRGVGFGRADVDPRNRALVREMGRVMRMMCGAHFTSTAKGRQ